MSNKHRSERRAHSRHETLSVKERGRILVGIAAVVASAAALSMQIQDLHESLKGPLRIGPDERTNVLAYRLHDAGEENDMYMLSDAQIRRRFKLAQRAIGYELGSGYRSRLDGISNVVLAADHTDELSGEPCYAIDDIDELVAGLSKGDDIADGELIQIISDDASLCEANSHDTPVGAYVSDNYQFYNVYSPQGALIQGFADIKIRGASTYVPSVILHELGHNFGLEHFYGVECTNRGDAFSDMYPPQDIRRVINGKAGCEVAVGASGQPDPYFAQTSVMGGNVSPDFKVDGASAYSTDDRFKLEPSLYPIIQVDTTPGSYTLEHGEGKRNGVSIMLPDDHVLRSLDSSIDRVLFTLEITDGYTHKADKYLQPKGCGSEAHICSLRAVATNADESLRFLLPTMDGVLSYNENTASTKSIEYLDKSLNLGVMIQEDPFGPKQKLVFMSYTDAQEKAAVQKQKLRQR